MLFFTDLILRTPVVSASAQTICHRFYYYYPFTKCHPFFGMLLYPLNIIVSMACVLIASKIEEELLPISRILKIFYPMYLHRTEQEILDLNETDEVEFLFFPFLGLSLLEKRLDGDGKACSFCFWISFLWYYRSSTSLCSFLYQSIYHHDLLK